MKLIAYWPQAGRLQIVWNQKADDADSWNITQLPHHQQIRRMFMSWSQILQSSPSF